MLTKPFFRLWSSQALSTSGDILYILALVAALYRLSGSAIVTSLFPLLRVAGMTAGSMAAPLLTSRLRLSRLLAGCLAGQTVLMSALALYMQLYGRHPGIPLLVGAVFLISILEGAASPARASLLPAITPKEALLKANSVLAGGVQLCSLAGWAFGAVMVARLGTGNVLIMSVFLLGSAWLFALGIRETDDAAHSPTDSWVRSLLAGWRHYLRVPRLRLLLWMDVWEGLFSAVFAGALLLVFAREQLHAGEEWWGWMNGAYLAGIVIMNAVLSRFPDQASRLGTMLAAGSGCFAAFTLCFGYTAIPAAALGVMLALGASQAVKELAQRTLLQTSVPLPELPPLFAAQSALISLLYGISLLLSGWLADRAGIGTLYKCAAAAFAVSFAAALVNKEVRRRPDRIGG